ncbi:MAG: bifunctional methylenetetrahydrofolate dehydrogenase/methenyltetrahydrofolate cyclohydrolase FolD [Clostridiales bacterium]|nr:MAG: bifunctional methylenetetrahydrofolate dehydrogenase/methenyltetrahydrofolate cyclohydrolase FolD [Clostridiales bacterium]
MAEIIDGKKIAAQIRAEIQKETGALAEQGVVPGLAVIIVGDNSASRVYVRNKIRACEEVGFYSENYELPANAPEQELLALIEKLNLDPKIHGILVQLPLPGHMDENKVILAIDPKKDVDAFHVQNVGKIMLGQYDFLPCTPAGVMKLLAYSGIEVAGKDCVVVGRSNIVGKPQAMLLMQADGTVQICHSKTSRLAEKTAAADILVVAIGKAKFITGDMIKKGAVVIDVGMNRDENGKLCGDVDFDSCASRASYITPVPGGVGPMTITMLLQNTLTAAKSTLL